MNHLRALVAAALLMLPLHLLAATVAAPSAFDRFMSLATGAGKTTVTLGSDGTPLAAPGVPTLQTDGGQPKATATGNWRNPSGNPVAVAATGRVKAAAIGGAIGRFLGKAAPVGYWIGVAGAGYQLAKELGLTGTDVGGNLVFRADTVQVWRAIAPPSLPLNGYEAGSYAAACVKAVGWALAVYGTNGGVLVYSAGASSPTSCRVNRINSTTGTNSFLDFGMTLVSTTSTPGTGPEVSNQEFVDMVAAKAGWPTSSAISQVLVDSATSSGVKLETDPLAVTGPATTPGKVVSTVNTTNNTTKTETTTHHHTYNGDTINTTTVTVTNVTNNTTGDTISSETKTETPEKEEDPPEIDVTDTPLPQQPKLYTPKYPNGLEGVWTQQKAALNATPLANLVGKLMPNVGSTGTCPVMNVDLSLAVWADFGTKDLAPPCYVWDWARLIVMVGALLLARALIFGG